MINLAAIEKTKRKNITELQYCTGMSRREIKLKRISDFFFNFQKIGSGGSVKRKINKLWPYKFFENMLVVCNPVKKHPLAYARKVTIFLEKKEKRFLVFHSKQHQIFRNV